jgi:cytosine/adenosine deaminase-related metal-dependent hydrolase
MTENNEHSDIYSRLMALSQESLEGGHYETAYHALVAAMHYAQALSDEKRLTKVKTVAKAQQDWINTHAPEHRMSVQSAVKRQGQSLYDVLARQAAMQQLIAQHEHRQKHTQRLSWLGDASE